MEKIILSVDGMKCGMCEAHVNDLARKVNGVKKVSSSHSKNETIIISEDNINVDELIESISKDGYHASLISKEKYEKKGLFSKLFKK